MRSSLEYPKRPMRNMRRSLSSKKLQIRPQMYQAYDEFHDEALLVHQLGSLSMPSDADDDVNINCYNYDVVEEPNVRRGGGGGVLTDPVVDLDRMIAETSARWKCTVTAIVSNTVTANTTTVSSATLTTAGSTNPASTGGADSTTVGSSFYNNVNSASSTASPQPAAIMAAAHMEPVISISTPAPSAIGMQSSLRRPQIVSRQSSTGTHNTILSVPAGTEHQVIEQQAAEIQALHAAIQAQQFHQQQPAINGYHNLRSSNPFAVQPPQFHNQHHPFPSTYGRFVPGMSVLNENSVALVETTNNNGSFANFHNSNNYVSFQPFAMEDSIDCAPVDHIEVHHDANYWQDDLTVWSGFNTVTGNPDSPIYQRQQSSPLSPDDSNHATFEDERKSPTVPAPMPRRRPDAESATGASALNGVPVRVVRDMEVKLSSGMTGVTRRALYSGTINAHPRLPEGQGTFIFKKTGDKYQGDVHNGKMHGAGTYTFGNRGKSKPNSNSDRPSELKGTFEHNVFIG